MPVAEYMLYAQGHTRQVPEFIGDRGHWYNPSDHTYIGWISNNPDFYVPDTIVYLNKEQFVERALRIHSENPMTKYNGDPTETPEIMTVEEVQQQAEFWYDNFVQENMSK